jgi:hypothetical protein
VEFAAFAAGGAAAATCGELEVDLSILAFEWEIWDLGKVVYADAIVDVFVNENTSG